MFWDYAMPIMFTPPPVETNSAEYQGFKRGLRGLDPNSLSQTIRREIVLKCRSNRECRLRILRTNKVNIVKDMLNQKGLLQKTAIAPVAEGLTYIDWDNLYPETALGEGFVIY